MSSPSEWLSSLMLLIALPGLLTVCLVLQHPEIPAPGIALCFAISGCLAAILLAPDRPVTLAEWKLPPGAWTPAAATVLVLASSWQEALTWVQLSRLGVAQLLVLLAFGQLQALLRVRLREPAAAALTGLLLTLMTATPVLLSPLAGTFSEHNGFVHLVVNFSPLSYFASALDYDYLRSNWFYDHLSLGSLRFEYANQLIWAGFAMVAALGLHAAGRAAASRVNRFAP